MKIRLELQHKSIHEQFHKLSMNDINKIINYNNFMKLWIKQRILDMCNVIIIMKDYFWHKNKITINQIDRAFAETVLNKIYLPCRFLYEDILHQLLQ